jgi:hypothetical protein
MAGHLTRQLEARRSGHDVHRAAGPADRQVVHAVVVEVAIRVERRAEELVLLDVAVQRRDQREVGAREQAQLADVRHAGEVDRRRRDPQVAHAVAGPVGHVDDRQAQLVAERTQDLRDQRAIGARVERDAAVEVRAVHPVADRDVRHAVAVHVARPGHRDGAGAEDRERRRGDLRQDLALVGEDRRAGGRAEHEVLVAVAVEVAHEVERAAEPGGAGRVGQHLDELAARQLEQARRGEVHEDRAGRADEQVGEAIGVHVARALEAAEGPGLGDGEALHERAVRAVAHLGHADAAHAAARAAAHEVRPSVAGHIAHGLDVEVEGRRQGIEHRAVAPDHTVVSPMMTAVDAMRSGTPSPLTSPRLATERPIWSSFPAKKLASVAPPIGSMTRTRPEATVVPCGVKSGSPTTSSRPGVPSHSTESIEKAVCVSE